MNYYGSNDWRDYHLAHYGVKGMKWNKHLKAATDWWRRDVTGSYYRKKAERHDMQAFASKTNNDPKISPNADLRKNSYDLKRGAYKAAVNRTKRYAKNKANETVHNAAALAYRKKYEDSLFGKAGKAGKSAGKAIASGAKKIGKSFVDSARTNGKKFKEFTKTHTPKTDKAVRSGVERVQKTLGRLTNKKSTTKSATTKSSINRPHSRKPKIVPRIKPVTVKKKERIVYGLSGLNDVLNGKKKKKKKKIW